MSSQSFTNLANSEFNGNIILKNGYIQFPNGSQQTIAGGGGGGGNVSTTTMNMYTNTSTNNFQAATITCATQPLGNNSNSVANTAFVQSALLNVGDVSTTTVNIYTNTSTNNFEDAEITCATQDSNDSSYLVANTAFVQTSTASVGIFPNNNFGLGGINYTGLTTGSSNNAYGYEALESITSGDLNNCIGNTAGNSITTGSGNNCIGNQSGNIITTGDANVSIGTNSLLNSNGSYNVAVGNQAGEEDIGLSSNNTYLGNSASQIGTDTHSYQHLTLIGANSQPVNVGTDNQIVLGRLNGDDELFIPGNNIFLGNQNNIDETYTFEASGSNSTIIFTAQDSVPTGYQNILTLSTTSNSVPTLSYLDNGTSIVNQTMLSTAFNNIIKTGSVTINGNQPSVVTFSTPFPIGVVPIVTVQNNQGALLNTIILITGNVSNTQFDVWESGAGSPIVMSINYIAIGLP